MTTTAPPTPSSEQPAAPEPPVRPQLRRSSTEKMAGGVCGGLAEYSGIDPLLWRVGFLGFTVAGGAGVLVYLLLWVLMPPAPVAPGIGRSPVDQFVDRLHDGITRLGSPRR